MGAGASTTADFADHIAEEIQAEQKRVVEGGADSADQAADRAAEIEMPAESAASKRVVEGGAESAEQAADRAAENEMTPVSAACKRVVEGGAESAEQGADRAAEVEMPPVVSSASIDARASTLVSNVTEDCREAVSNLLLSVKGKLSPEQLGHAISEMQQALPLLKGDAILVSCAGSLAAACEMLPEVCTVLGATLAATGEHLPYLGVACGAVGTILYTFRLSKGQDKEVETVRLWAASVKDWLLLVADKVERSKAESTLPLFQGLQEALTKMAEQIHQRGRKHRLTKMVTSTVFERDFGRAKAAVLELKAALRDFLDQEQQDRQEAALEQVARAQGKQEGQLSSLEEQLASVRALLEAQAQATAAAAAAAVGGEPAAAMGAAAEEEAAPSGLVAVKDEEERLFESLQRAAGVGGDADVPFARFVAAFEALFYAGGDMPAEQQRGLRAGLDKHRTKQIGKPQWLKFYRRWTASGLEVGAFLERVAAENPTLFAAAAERGKAAKAQAALAAGGAREKGKAARERAGQAAAEARERAARAAAEAGERARRAAAADQHQQAVRRAAQHGGAAAAGAGRGLVRKASGKAGQLFGKKKALLLRGAEGRGPEEGTAETAGC